MLKELGRATLHQQLLLFAPNATGPLLLGGPCPPAGTAGDETPYSEDPELTEAPAGNHVPNWICPPRQPEAGLPLPPQPDAPRTCCLQWCHWTVNEDFTPTPLKQRPPLFPHPKHHPPPQPASLPPTGGEADAGSQQEVGFPGPWGQGGNVSPRPSLGDEDQIPPSPKAIRCAGSGRAQETQLHFQELSLEVVTAEVCRVPPLRISIPVLFIIANAQQ